MMRSMYSGVAGLKNHQTRMDVIGNNIANVNTVGYKKSRVVFKDTLYQSIRGGSRPTDARGGTNPMAIGMGMTVSSVDQIHTPAPATITNKLTDMAIDGNGYFIVDNGGQKFYTRAGAFDFDRMGNLVNTSNGYKVHGWMADEKQNINTIAETRPIDISAYKSVKPKATTTMNFSGNLDSKKTIRAGGYANPPVWNVHPTDEESVITSKEAFDSLGNKVTLYYRFFKTGVEADGTTKWACDITVGEPNFEKMENFVAADYEAVDILAGVPPAGGTRMLRVYNIEFNTEGKIKELDLAQLTLNIDRAPNGAEDIEIDIDFKNITQYNAISTAWVDYQNGYTKGDLVSFSIGLDGNILGVYDNGEVKNMARVAVANFQNPSGLMQTGNNLFQISNNSGDARIGAPGEQGMGGLLPGSLEMSNVDLSEEFTDMIVTQRGFQANSRLITTSDEMLQELVNLKR